MNKFLTMALLAPALATAAQLLTPASATPPAMPAVPAGTYAPPATGDTATIPLLTQAVNNTSQEVTELRRILNEHMERRPGQDPSLMQKLLGAGVGAGLGYVASSYVMTNAIAPLVSMAAFQSGLSDATSTTITSSVTSLGVVWGTYAGSVYGRDLVAAP